MAKSRVEISEEDKKKKISKQGLLETLKLFSFIQPYKWWFISGLILLILSTITGLTFPKLAGSLVNLAAGKPDSSFTSIQTLAYVFVAVLILQAIVSFFRIYTFSVVTENTLADIRQALYQKILTLPISFFEKHRVGELNSRLSNDTTTLQDMLSISLAEFIRQVFTLIGGIAFLLYTSAKLTLFMILTFPLIIIVALFFGKFIRKTSKATSDVLAQTNIIVEESMQNIQTVKAFTNERFEKNRYAVEMKKLVKTALKSSMYRGLFFSFFVIGIFGCIIAVLLVGAKLAIEGKMQVGELFSFSLYTIFIGASVAGMGELYGQLQKTLGATERIREILNLESEINFSELPIDKVEMKNDIEFKNVRFSYPTRQDVDVLNGINFTIKAGEKVAFVGSSGAGKSTIAQLLLRNYKVTNGNILMDNKNIQNIDLTAYREIVGIVPQEVLLFGGTIRENIAYGKINASENEIIQAAKDAFAWDFIESFPDKLNTIVGERGVKLSGGQRQRIAIARAILKNPSILILDEATSALDSESEYMVQEALNNLMKNRTTIIIAHRLSTIREADNIFVLQNGIIAEQGKHDKLIQNEQGIYYNLTKIQQEAISVQV
jgi:ATP-binding cassette subfamily B protein